MTLGRPEALKAEARVVAVTRADPAELLEALAPEGLVLYVHGYNINFQKSCRRAALAQHNLGLADRLLLFSWPADGNAFNYLHDVADMEWSARHLATLISELVDRLGAGRVHLMGHSLGARGLVRALERDQSWPAVASITLIAADMDAALFRDDLFWLHQRADRINVYVSGHDRAMKASRQLNGNLRLGAAMEIAQQTDPLPPNVAVVDVTPSGTHEVSGHLYHLFNPAVVTDLSARLGDSAPVSGVVRLTPAD